LKIKKRFAVHIAWLGSVVRQLRPEVSGLVSQFRVRQMAYSNACLPAGRLS